MPRPIWCWNKPFFSGEGNCIPPDTFLSALPKWIARFQLRRPDSNRDPIPSGSLPQPPLKTGGVEQMTLEPRQAVTQALLFDVKPVSEHTYVWEWSQNWKKLSIPLQVPALSAMHDHWFFMSFAHGLYRNSFCTTHRSFQTRLKWYQEAILV